MKREQKGAKGRRKGTKGRPNGAKTEPRSAKSSQKGAKKDPRGAKGSQKGAKGRQKGTKGGPKGIQKSAWAPGSILGAKRGGTTQSFWEPFWDNFPPKSRSKSMQKSMSKNMIFHKKTTPNMCEYQYKIHENPICSRKGVFDKSTIIAGLFAQNHDWAPSKNIKNDQRT